jgi:hypothetical protein
MISVYNAEKQELMGIYRNMNIVCIFIYGVRDSIYLKRLERALSCKYKITNDTKFDHPIAIRSAKKEHQLLLGDLDGITMDPYPKVHLTRFLGLKSNKFK